jgi:hypothetical protein
VTATTARSLAEQADNTLKTADTIVASLVERVEAEGTGPEARAVSGLAESGIPRGGGIEESSESDSALREYHGQTLFVGLARARGRGS